MSLRSAISLMLAIALAAQVIPTAAVAIGSFSNFCDAALSTVQIVPGTTSLENLAVRYNGDILVTSISTSSLFQISPTKSHHPILIAEIPLSASLLGIAELQKDVFYVVASDLSQGLSPPPGSTSVWKLDMRQFRAADSGRVIRPAKVTQVARMPSAQLFNGMCRLALDDNINLLIADSGAGTIVKLNVETGAYETIIQDPAMAKLSTGLGIGVNGIHTHGTYLFFTNLDQRIFACVPISLHNGTATGPVEVITSGLVDLDDFALSKDGKTAWVAVNGPQTLIEIDILEKTTRVAANSTLLMSESSVVVGRSYTEQSTLFITTAATAGNSTIGQLVKAKFPFSINA